MTCSFRDFFEVSLISGEKRCVGRFRLAFHREGVYALKSKQLFSFFLQAPSIKTAMPISSSANL